MSTGSDVRKELYGEVRPVDVQDSGPVLSVVIDTEEEFDWSKPHNRNNTSTTAMRHVGRAQDIFNRYGVKPCYVVDYPVAVNTADHEQLKQIHDDGLCSIGSHLHPWVTPPHDEDVTVYNSFPGNLERELEYAKLQTVTDTIEENFGCRPRAYKAGRYGVGPNTRAILEELGYEVELSPTPGFDYSDAHGPDFSHYANTPFWFGQRFDKLCLPCTGGYVGILGGRAAAVYPFVTKGFLGKLRVPGVLARLGVLERIRLSPEGFTLTEMQRITRFLVKQGVRHFTLSFHSPSVAVGCTPYVNSESELTEFLSKIDNFLQYFQQELGGEFRNPETIRGSLIG